MHRPTALLAPLASLVLLLAAVAAHSAEPLRPLPPDAAPADLAKAKAKDLEKQRLIAKLHADAPRRDESRIANPLDAPIFHRYDRPGAP